MNEPTQANAVRIVIVDDHPMVRERLAEIINREADMKVCGEAEDRPNGLEVIGREKPDLAIIDLTLKRSNGLDLIKDLRAMHPQLRILVVSMQEENLYAERVIRAGAHGYITKQEATRKILEAIRMVLAGKVYLSDALSADILSRMVGKSKAPGSSFELLTDRELQVFNLVGQGFSTRQIAEQLGLDVKTVETYRARIKDKLELKDASELLRKAIAWKLDHPTA
ncbi:response regulator [Luteolibacter sp. Populi]|uniref:response regulator n=1 Tax=Luteolibacter sp. Populi TaxID=3230487 RepID=UPI003467577C